MFQDPGCSVDFIQPAAVWCWNVWIL